MVPDGKHAVTFKLAAPNAELPMLLTQPPMRPLTKVSQSGDAEVPFVVRTTYPLVNPM